ncbi:Holliday junction branch migration protein RuvA [Treponema pectinovorum]|uniref:Holliday junction branch migration protein RuvA n=1 Tax=Treponema pectinovorum TaxID=164 RepID=UPI003D8E096E
MFNSITGLITGKFPKQLFLSQNGIEWDFCVPDSNLELFPNVGSEAKVYTWLQHTDNLMTLYGFSSKDERAIFLDLLKVDGVGPKGAVKIMSSVSSSTLMQILESGDVASLEKIQGVGKKTAAKMMLALKGKLTLLEDSKIVRLENSNPFADVVSSLVSMGYEKKNVEQKVFELASKNQEFLKDKSQKEQEDFIFRKAIVEFA